ncbi:hypothetical protein C8T65DRAFT_828793 [Cerioporus squamosus]|nr:hypothetical protein C8T65DRAFT_828793 [Cerioporus squamosus]
MTTTFVRSSAFNLAGPGITATFIPAPSLTSTVKAAQPTRRPNKADLEVVLLRAQIRTHHRRLRALIPLERGLYAFHAILTLVPLHPFYCHCGHHDGYGRRPESPGMCAALPLPVPTGQSGQYFPDAPSPSLLPTPTFGSAAPAARPRLVQSSPRYGSARDTTGRGHSFVTNGDPALTPRHVFPPNLRRTPGAPVWADDYFRGPVGLGIMNMDIDVDVKDNVYVEQYYFETAAV